MKQINDQEFVVWFTGILFGRWISKITELPQ